MIRLRSLLLRCLVHGLWFATINSFVATTNAQDLPGPLAEPITTLDLMQYADRLDLEETQCEAIRDLHDEYKKLYKNLYHSEILPALKRFIFQKRNQQADRNGLEKYRDRMDTLLRRIRSLDVNLFEHLKSVMTQDQHVRLRAIELQRERNRLFARYDNESLVSWPNFDIIKVVHDLKLSEVEVEAVEALLANYEQTLTQKLREFATSKQLNYVDIELAIRMTSINGDKTQQELENILINAIGPVEEQAQEIRDIYIKTYQLLSNALSNTSARQIRDALREAVYRDTILVTRRLLGGKEAKIAIASKGLSPEQYESIIAGENDRNNQLDPILEEAFLVAHKYYGLRSNIVSRPEIEDELFQGLNRLMARAKEVDERAREKLKAVVGQERYKTIQADLANSSGKRRHQRGTAAAKIARMILPIGVSKNVLIGIAQADARQPYPIGEQDLDDYSWLLDVDDKQNLVIQIHYQDYIEEYEQNLKPAISAFAKANRKASGATPDLDGITAKELSKELKSVRQAVFELDDKFFSNIKLTVDKAQASRLKRVRQARTRELYGVWHRLDPGPIYVSRIDLLWLVRSLEFTSVIITELNPLLVTYEEVLTDLLIQMYDQQVEREDILLEYRHERRRVQIAEAGEEEIQAAAELIEPRLNRISDRLRSLDALIGQLNERTLSTLEDALSPQDSRRLINLFNRLAYPTVYKDPTYIGKLLKESLLNPNLVDEILISLQILNTSYLYSYEELSQKMINIMSEISESTLKVDSSIRREREENLRFLLFERNELNQRAIWRTRSIFLEAAMDHLGGLPDPSAIKKNIWHFR